MKRIRKSKRPQKQLERLSNLDRIDNYVAQTGGYITPRQRRRIEKKQGALLSL